MAPEHGSPGSGGRTSSAHTVLRGAGPSETPPTIGQGAHEEQTSAGLRLEDGALGTGETVPACVGDFDAEGVADDVQREPEVPAGDAAVGDRVGRQLGDDVDRRFPRESPGAELFGGEQTGEAGSAGCGGQQDAEVAHSAAELGRGGGSSMIHVTQSGRMRLP